MTSNGATNGKDMTAAQSRRMEDLQFINEMLGQLQKMADAERCDMLGYLINMAKVESGDILAGSRPFRVVSQHETSPVQMANGHAG